MNSETRVVLNDPLRRYYRDALVYILNLAYSHVYSVTGELRVYRYIDVRWGLRAALDRGARIEACASSAKVSPDLVNAALSDGVKLHLLREEPLEKFMVVDSQHYLVAAPSSSKDEAGRLYLNDPDGARMLERKFQAYLAKSDPARMAEQPDELYAIP